MSIRLIVNADDYGMTPGTSAGIREAHLRGIVTSTTTMMNFPGAESALRTAMSDCPKLGLGVHLVLTGGAPLMPLDRVPSLINENGRFYGEKATIARLNQFNLDEVRSEWRTQIEKFAAITGHLPDHLDSHHHVSYFTPGLFRVMLELAQSYRCPIRLPVAADNQLHPWIPKLAADDPARVQYAELLREYQPRYPNWLNLEFYDEGVTAENLAAIMANLRDGVTELMCHPAQIDDELRQISVYVEPRAREVTLLTDPTLPEKLRTHGIELINFGQA